MLTALYLDIWLAIVFWSAIGFYLLKDILGKSWEDFCGGWSILGSITLLIFWILSKKQPDKETLPKLTIVRLLLFSIVLAGFGIYILTKFIQTTSGKNAGIADVILLIFLAVILIYKYIYRNK